MSLTLRVDGDRWRAHLRETAAAYPGVVPVAKGNGYGLGIRRLARKAKWLGVDTMAVGTYDELPDALSRFTGDIVVLSPWRPFLPKAVKALEGPEARRIVHTVGRAEDLAALSDVEGRPRVLLEVQTSMLRHGFPVAELPSAVEGVRVQGLSVHLPLVGAENAAELDALLNAVGSQVPGATVWVSHLTPSQVTEAAARFPHVRLRPRVGTALWLGDEGALHVTATVLDRHDIKAGDTYGYRRRKASRAGTILIVSGGTAHGIGLESPTGDLTPRTRAATIARGGLDALGKVRSPFLIAGVQPTFAEPPHMQSSMLFLPRGAKVPEVGDEIGARIRHTATTFDRVVID